jgi:hypothetical protein
MAARGSRTPLYFLHHDAHIRLNYGPRLSKAQTLIWLCAIALHVHSCSLPTSLQPLRVTSTLGVIAEGLPHQQRLFAATSDLKDPLIPAGNLV